MESMEYYQMFKTLDKRVLDSLENALNQIKEVIMYIIVEYLKIASSCAIGFAIMGAVGYFIKLVFIPINNIILSAN